MLDASLRAARRALVILTLAAPAALAQLPAASTGASLFVIDSAEIAASNARTLSELLAARVPGLSVMRSGGSADEGVSLRSRGAHSFVVSSAPVLVVDGVRVSARQGMSVIGTAVNASEIDELLPEDIARVEVLPGPAAAARYGPGAANGAIVITTKSGGAGPFTLGARTYAGLSFENASWPANYHMTGTSTSTGQPATNCSLLQVERGACTPASLQRFDPLEQASPFHVGRTGTLHLHGSAGRGGTGAYFGVAAERTDGVLSGDELRRLTARVHVAQQLPWHLSLDASGGVLRDDALLPNLFAKIGAGLVGYATADSSNGYRRHGPDRSVESLAERAMGSVSLRWRPSDWLDAAVVGGHDRVSGRESVPVPFLVPAPGDTSFGEHLGTMHDDVKSLGATVTARYRPRSALAAATTLSVERYAYRRRSLDSLGFPGSLSMTSWRLDQPISGVSLAQRLVWRDRLTVDAALWRGGPASYSIATRREVYPSASVAWALGRIGPASGVRLRAAYGEAAAADPGPPVVFQSGTVPSFVSVPASRAERTRETEVGADLAFGERLGLALTAFRADSRHLVMLQQIATEYPPAYDVWTGGGMRDAGIALLLHAVPLRRGALAWTVTGSLSTLRNRVTSTGGPPALLATSSPYVVTAVAIGQPVGSPWGQPYTFADVNGDHLIDTTEVQRQSARLIATTLPAVESAIRSGLTLPHGVFAVITLDYRGGYRMQNANELARCSFGICRGAQDPAAPLDQQAAVVALHNNLYQAAAFIDDASFLRLRELSVGWTLPARWARFPGDATRISLVGRDLATFTRYKGIDPEITGGAPDELPRYDFEKLPILPTILLRVDLGDGGR